MLSVCAVITMAACNQENDTLNVVNDGNVEMPTVVQVKDGEVVSGTRAEMKDAENALNFKNEESLNSFVEKLQPMTFEERLLVIKNLDVTNRFDIASLADAELDSIDSISTSESDFLDKYGKYEEKYKGLLVRNSEDTEDLSLYVPDGDNINAYIGNKNLNIVVSGNVRQLSLSDDVAESVVQETQMMKALEAKQSLAATSTSYTNSFVYTKDKKRLYFNTYLTGQNFHVKMHMKKKMWYGWKNDSHRQYFFESYLSVLNYYINGHLGTRQERYIFTSNVSNGFDIILGTLATAKLTGQIYTWTDMTTDHDSNGNQLYETVQNTRVPKCSKSKAIICNISY